jgi:PCI domain
VFLQVLLNKIIGPYKCVRIPFVADKIKCSEPEAERLLASLILDGRIHGHIDQVKQHLILDQYGPTARPTDAEPTVDLYEQIKKWALCMDKMKDSLLTKSVT